MSDFQGKLKKIRKDNGYTQEQLATLLNLKRSTIANIENGTQRPTTDFLIPFAKNFNVSLDYLFGLDKVVKSNQVDESINEIVNSINESNDISELKTLAASLTALVEAKLIELEEIKGDMKRVLKRIPDKL